MPLHRSRIPILLAIAFALFLTAASAFLLYEPAPLTPSLPQPPLSFDQASARIAELQTQDPPGVRPECRTRFTSQGAPTEYALVYFHGFGNCPQQADPILRLASERGWNVFAPRMPRNGFATSQPDQIGQLTAEELAGFAAASAQIATGLGRKVIIAGLSVGGAVAAFTAERHRFHRAVLIAPCFGLSNLGRFGSHVLMKTALLLPDRFIRYPEIGPAHSYPGFSTHAIAHALRFSELALYAPAPATRDLRVILNAHDSTVDEESTVQLIHRWTQQGASVRHITIPQSHRLIHDLVDPAQPLQNTATAYPYLLPHLLD